MGPGFDRATMSALWDVDHESHLQVLANQARRHRRRHVSDSVYGAGPAHVRSRWASASERCHGKLMRRAPDDGGGNIGDCALDVA